MGYKPDPLLKANFEYSPLSQVFNKGFDKDDKNEGLLKRLKIIEDKADNQLRAIEGQERAPNVKDDDIIQLEPVKVKKKLQRLSRLGV